MLAPTVLLLLLAAEEGPAPRCTAFELSLAGIGSLEEELARTAGLAGSAPLWPGLLRRPSGARPLWLCDGPAPRPEDLPDPVPLPELRWDVVPPLWLTKELTGWADDRNDGALWAGRGLGSSLSGGVRARWRWFTAQLAPLAAWQENRSYPVPPGPAGYSPYANPFNGGAIDLPLRMGPSSFWTFDWGQSFVRAEAFGLAAGFSTENLWWGPGLRNSLLMTNTGPGFPHLFLGTARPLDISIGWLEAEAGWARLRPSRWFDGDTGNRRLLEWAVYTFAPAFQRNLTLGLARVWVYPDADVNRDVYLMPLLPPVLKVFEPSRVNGRENGIVSLFFRWAFPEVHFAAYGEWGRDDLSNSLRDFIDELGHAQAYQFGLEKLFPAGRRWIRLQAELTHTFEMPPGNPTRAVPIFYTHHAARQGYTQAGQMIGAGLGPQGDTQFLAVDAISGSRSLGGFLERTVRHERWFYDHVAGNKPLPRHDLEMALGARGSHAWREWDLSWEAAVTGRGALDFQRASSWNLDAALRLTYWPGRAEAPALPAPGRGGG